MLTQLKADYPEDLRVVYRHFPLNSIHDKAAIASQASEAAGAQGKFWEMHDLLYQNQAAWGKLSMDEFEDWAAEQAEELGLDGDQFMADMLSTENADLAEQAWVKGQETGIPGTPFLLVNDRIYDGPTDYLNLSTVIKLYALQDKQYTECPPQVIDLTKEYIATIKTEKGDIVIKLFANEAPVAVNNFVFLAQEGWYDGITFHRVLADFMAQSGDPSGTGFGGPGYTFVNETSPDIIFDRAGLLAMANAGPDTNGSQFFITHTPQEHLSGGYTIFGEVLEGLEIATSLTLRNPAQGGNLPPGDEIVSITIEAK